MPQVNCGPHVRQGVAHGVGVGFTFDAAVDMAEWAASQVARSQATNWEALQTCPANCPKQPAPPAGPNYVIGGLMVRNAFRPMKSVPGWADFGIVEVTVDWIAWFVCGTPQEAATYSPPRGAIPEQYKHGTKPVQPPGY